MKTILEKLEDRREICRIQQAMWADDRIEVGDFTYGMPHVHLWDQTTKLKVGKFCSIADGVHILLGGEHRTDRVSTYPFDVLLDDQPTPSKGDVIIGNDVWIGHGATILSGVTIGNCAVIGAKAVVTKDVQPGDIVAGVPARGIGVRWVALDASRMRWWDWPVEKLADAYRFLTDQDVPGMREFSRRWDDEHGLH